MMNNRLDCAFGVAIGGYSFGFDTAVIDGADRR